MASLPPDRPPRSKKTASKTATTVDESAPAFEPETSTVASKKQPKRLSGFLNKLETRAIGGGQLRRKYWFVLSTESPVLLWYRSSGDLSNPVGRCSLSGASFTFDPRNKGLFEIRCSSDEVYSLETSSSQARLQWLQALQLSRRRYFETQEASHVSPTSRIFDTVEAEPSCISATIRPHSPVRTTTTATDDDKRTSDATTVCVDGAALAASSEQMQASPDAVVPPLTADSPAMRPKRLETMTTEDRLISFCDDDEKSTFYLNMGGDLNDNSFQPPPVALKPPTLDDVLTSTTDVINAVVERSRARLAPSEGDGDTGADKRASRSGDETLGEHRRSVFPIKLIKQHRPAACEGCKELISAMNTLKDYCVDVKDEMTATQEVVTVLRNSLSCAKNQIDALKRVTESTDLSERLEFILERESHLTVLQLKCCEQGMEIARLTEELRLASEREAKTMEDLNAYKESVRTKEELIMKLVNQTETDASNAASQSFEEDGGATSAAVNVVGCDVAVDVAEAVGAPSRRRTDSRGVSFRGASVDQPQRVSGKPETLVEDVAEMGRLRDLVNGYQTQNQFLNQEIMELQKMVRYLDDKEKESIRKNFDIEAVYYQLKSKYVMLLNHARAPHGARPALEASVLEELVNDATRTEEGGATACASSALTDSLGFYVGRRRSQAAGNGATANGGGATATNDDNDDLLNTAAVFKKKADEITFRQRQENSEEYVTWLARWDNLLVNFTDKPLVPTADFKQLVRTGVPRTYRTRVWKSLVSYWTKDMRNDVGNGYYETLVRRSMNAEDDALLKLIDADLARTLPRNKHFESTTAGKIEELRRVLYAYRWYNKEVGYCQGLNRIAAVALLNLEQEDAFWFLVAFVGQLQPPDYYTASLLGAIVDQKVFLDVVADKLPRLCAHLRALREVDLSCLTLKWFLTCFIDVLSHGVYLNLFDDFLCEGNKVLFRFGVAVLKMNEAELLSCKTADSVQTCLTHCGDNIHSYDKLAQIAFHELNPFPMKNIENRRQHYRNELSKSS